MPQLTFQIDGAKAIPYAATPQLNLKTQVACADPSVRIQNVLLQCQIQIEPARRHYDGAEQEKLKDLFGAPSRWGQTLRQMLWANSSVTVPSFQEQSIVDVPLPCTFDFNVAVTKYLYGLESGEVPLCILFSGTIFYVNESSQLEVAKIPWDQEVNYRLPVRIWKEMMDLYYPNAAWLCLQRDVFDQIYRYKIERGILTWDRALQSLLIAAEENELRKANA
jgi:Family of unknown function (DUF6084)